MREITSHKVNGCNESLGIYVLDGPGAGGANHLYSIEGFSTASNESCPSKERHVKPFNYTTILFQNGPIRENGTNGITQEALLAIVEDRLKCFQAGPYACRENAIALTKIQEAMMWLQKRTTDRMMRGVEGTMEK